MTASPVWNLVWIGGAIAVAVGVFFALRSRALRGVAATTFAEGLRMGIVVTSLVALLVTMAFLLLNALRDDGTLTHRLQLFLTWSLILIGFFMGLGTIFFSCMTLSREFVRKTMQMTVVKPVTRLEILLGKWLGVNALNLIVVGVCGLAIYGFALVIRGQTEQFQRDRVMINDAVWTARIAATPKPPDFVSMATQMVQDEARRSEIPDQDAAIRQRVQELAEMWRRVPPGVALPYQFVNLPAPDQSTQAFQIRFKARGDPLPSDEMVRIIWTVVDPETGAEVWSIPTAQRTNEMHQFLLGKAAIFQGRAVIIVENPGNPHTPDSRTVTIAFEGPDSLQLLYKVGSFEGNYLKVLVLLFCILAFLSAVGLFFATFTTFPVAAFCTLAGAMVCMGAPFFREATGMNLQANIEGDKRADPYGVWGKQIRAPLRFVFQGLLPDFTEYSNLEPLADGRAILDRDFALATGHTLLYGLVVFIGGGWLILRRREVAQVIV